MISIARPRPVLKIGGVPILAFLVSCAPAPVGQASPPPTADPGSRGEAYRIEWGLVIHGGAGTITRGMMTAELESDYHAVLERALLAGHSVLAAGGSGLDAVVAANVIMEDSPLFNAGRGAVFTAEGRNELDASIMDGAQLRAGAVAGVTRVRNPIILARVIMDSSPHVMLAREGAEEFAALQGLELVDPAYFFTERRWDALERARAAEARHSGVGRDAAERKVRPHGTVGVVALARDGTIAAGTTTGGMTNKRWGRVGDVPIIGAGTYADDRCGVSTTGWGEFFIINVVAHDICARMRYGDITLAQAADEVVWQRLEVQQPETGGIVALDSDGNVVMTFNSQGMYRGYIDQDGHVHTAIYR